MTHYYRIIFVHHKFHTFLNYVFCTIFLYMYICFYILLKFNLINFNKTWSYIKRSKSKLRENYELSFSCLSVQNLRGSPHGCNVLKIMLRWNCWNYASIYHTNTITIKNRITIVLIFTYYIYFLVHQLVDWNITKREMYWCLGSRKLISHFLHQWSWFWVGAEAS